MLKDINNRLESYGPEEKSRIDEFLLDDSPFVAKKTNRFVKIIK